MDKQMKREQGITLIALVVTIVVLLILAAVSISMLTGENGIITQAQNSKEQTEIGYEKEQVSLAYASAKTKKISEGDTSEINANDMNDQLNLQKANATARGSNPIIVKFNDSKREYEIDNNGEVAERPSSDIEMSNIFEYKIENNEVTILGVKDEYLEPYEAGSLNNNRKIASIHNPYIAEIEEPTLTKLVEEIGTALEIPETIEEKTVVDIGYQAFAGIVNLESIIIPDTVRIMQNAIFQNCYNLKNVKLSNNINLLGEKLFGNCTELTTISIPNSVESIKSTAFENCTNLANITIPDSINHVEARTFEDTAWYNNQPNGDIYIGKVYYKYKGTIPINTTINIKNGTIEIAEGAFYEQNRLTNIVIPDSVTSINNSAFFGCTGITSITIPDSVEYIGLEVFGHWEENQTINCEATEKPSEWNKNWDCYNYTLTGSPIPRKAQLNWGIK